MLRVQMAAGTVAMLLLLLLRQLLLLMVVVMPLVWVLVRVLARVVLAWLEVATQAAVTAARMAAWLSQRRRCAGRSCAGACPGTPKLLECCCPPRLVAHLQYQPTRLAYQGYSLPPTSCRQTS
jgi:hypothetical protein